MKILLFGEFSGFMNCLKIGLQGLGHEVFLASDGDSFKNYPSDFRWDTILKGKSIGKIIDIANIFLHKRLFSGYDAVLVISPRLFSYHKLPNSLVYNYLIRNNKKVFYCSSGMNTHSARFWYNKENSKYQNYVKCMLGDDSHSKSWSIIKSEEAYEWEDYFLNNIAGIIPIWYEYAEPFRDYKNLCPTVRIPISIEQFEYKENIVKDKVIFYHGITRPQKGTKYILEAFNRLREKYVDEAEFIARDKMPFDEYMKVVESTNVIIDDANSYSVAMNGLFSMAKGKIIMGGAEPEGNKELGFTDNENPVFNICPDVDQICSVIEYIIKNKDKIPEWGLKSRKFVEKNHNYLEIAQQYVDIFNKY